MMPTQSANGRPHLAYYVDGFSFVWSGWLNEPIEVCHGGYGEPVTALVSMPPDVWQTGHATALVGPMRTFATVCDEWLARDDEPVD